MASAPLPRPRSTQMVPERYAKSALYGLAHCVPASCGLFRVPSNPHPLPLRSGGRNHPSFIYKHNTKSCCESRYMACGRDRGVSGCILVFGKRSGTILTFLKSKQADACLPLQFLFYPARKLSQIDTRNITVENGSWRETLLLSIYSSNESLECKACSTSDALLQTHPKSTASRSSRSIRSSPPSQERNTLEPDDDIAAVSLAHFVSPIAFAPGECLFLRVLTIRA